MLNRSIRSRAKRAINRSRRTGASLLRTQIAARCATFGPRCALRRRVGLSYHAGWPRQRGGPGRLPDRPFLASGASELPGRVFRSRRFAGSRSRWAASSKSSESLRRQERVSGGALPSPDSHEYSGPDHGQMCQVSDLRHAGVRRPIIRPARLLHSLLCGAVPIVRLNKPDRDSGLQPLRSSLRHKTLGAIL